MRSPPQIQLGKEYSGAAVRRNALDDFDEGEGLHASDTEDEPLNDESAKNNAGNAIEQQETSEIYSNAEEAEESYDEVAESGEELDLAAAAIDPEDDEEIDSDEAFNSEDEERYRSYAFRAGKKNVGGENPRSSYIVIEDAEFPQDRGSENDLEDEMDDDIKDDTDTSGDQDEIEADETDDTTMSDAEDNSSYAPKITNSTTKPSSDRSALRELMSKEKVNLASSIAATNTADASKGRAIRQQYKTFDRLLDARIKLQKGIAASNSLPSSSDQWSVEIDAAVGAAEQAALKLFSTIESMRYSFLDSQSTSNTSKKRKRPSPPEPSLSNSDLWARMQTLDVETLPYRRSTLNKWSAKVRTTQMAASSSKPKLLEHQPQQDKITDVLDAYLSTQSEKLIAQATSTSNPAATKDTSTQPQESLTYDDTPFYQSLLCDLIATRSSLSHPTPSTPSTSIIPPTSMKAQQSGTLKTRADTKASKGRKVRYTAHEKIEGFEADDDVVKWTEGAGGEFYRSLMGRGLLAGTGDSSKSRFRDSDADSEDEGVGALKLFASR